MKGAFNLNLNISTEKHRKQGIADINKLERAIERGIQDGIDEMEKVLAERLRINLISYGLGASSLMSNISVHGSKNGIQIMVGTEYAKFVEFGTGVPGQNDPHPTGGSYNEMRHPNAHRTTRSGEDYWIYNDNGEIGVTMGMPSRHFMYDTWLYGTRIANQKITKNINRSLREVGF
jgi:hypothetical protein